MSDDVEAGAASLEGMGPLLHAVLNEQPQKGPPWTHTFRPPEPEPVLDNDGQPVHDDDGEPVLAAPQGPHFTIHQIAAAAAAEKAVKQAMHRLVTSVGESAERMRGLAQAVEQMAVPPPDIRMVGGRRMQCKDIPDSVFLHAVRRSPGPPNSNWRTRWNVREGRRPRSGRCRRTCSWRRPGS